jgi:hypothetical protein
MSTRAKLLAVLSLPAGLAGYLIAGEVLTRLGIAGGAGGLLLVFVPLFVAGLCMMPLVIPLFDEMAKRDLAAAPPRDDDEDRTPPA